MQLTFHTLDVFTEQRFGGNPLAVVHDADALSSEQMQQIAGEFNLSETVFLLKAENPAHSARVRIFTPQKELPFAGHPTVGAAALLAELRTQELNGERDALIVLEQSIGTVRVGVRMRSGAAAFAEFDAPKLPAEAGALPAPELLAAGLGLSPNEIGFENHKPLCYAAGSTFAFVPISTLDAIKRARINGAHWTRAFEEQGVIGAYIYTRQCEHTTSAFHVRMFAPSVGVAEDPATGSAAGPLACHLCRHGLVPWGHEIEIEQGVEIGRPSTLYGRAEGGDGRIEGVEVGGRAVVVARGEFRL
jgi:trans-2,3-dihydro-3-hydroxyanthranilate isomerase